MILEALRAGGRLKENPSRAILRKIGLYSCACVRWQLGECAVKIYTRKLAEFIRLAEDCLDGCNNLDAVKKIFIRVTVADGETSGVDLAYCLAIMSCLDGVLPTFWVESVPVNMHIFGEVCGSVLMAQLPCETHICPRCDGIPVPWRSPGDVVASDCGQCFGIGRIFGRSPWLTPDVMNITAAIYRDHLWEEYPVLADALEDAGCNDQDELAGKVLSHLRRSTDIPCYACDEKSSMGCWICQDKGVIHLPHCRGCWVLDLLIGKHA